MTRLPRPHIGLNPVIAQLTSAAIAGVIVVLIAVIGSNLIQRTSKSVARESDAALLASQISADTDAVAILQLDRNAPADGAAAGASSNVQIPLNDAIAAHDALNAADEKGQELHRLIGSDVTLQISGATGEAKSALDIYLSDPTRTNFSNLRGRMQALRLLAAVEIPRLTASAQTNQDNLLNGAWYVRIALIVATVVATMGTAATTLLMGRRLSRALRHAEQETERLVETSRAMQRRNDQFSALYQIVGEVSESLNMRYVVNTAIREARKLVGADVVALRRLEQNRLILAGVEDDGGDDTSALTVVALGTGITGRVAKRGKTIRIDAGADAQMGEGERVPGIASGIVVPLIVGARVVGTLGCWSRRPAHFDADDERILEMMASQVATAVAAADIHEATDRDAHLDALTTLPNRRQLHEDLGASLLDDLAAGEPMTVAMIDIDNFKRFNDDYGHKMGDITLQKVAEVLRSTLRPQDRVYRFGGEEFLIVFKGAGSELGAQLSERLRAAVGRTVLTGEHLEPVGPVTISIGVAAFPEHGRGLDELIDLADRAMYASKEAGRNLVTISGEAPQHAAAA